MTTPTTAKGGRPLPDASPAAPPPPTGAFPAGRPATEREALAAMEMILRLPRGPGSPRQPPDWRRRRAERRVGTGRRRDPRVDDRWTDLGVRYLRASEAERLGPALQPVGEVVRLLRDAEPWARRRLESLLLTDAPLGVVAARTGLRLSVVETYQAMAFCVRDFRHARDWVALNAVGKSFMQGDADVATVWRGVAYHFGLPALDVAVAATHALGLSPAPGWPTASAHHIAAARDFVSALMLPADARAGKLWDLHRRLTGAGRGPSPGDPPTGPGGPGGPDGAGRGAGPTGEPARRLVPADVPW